MCSSTLSVSPGRKSHGTWHQILWSLPPQAFPTFFVTVSGGQQSNFGGVLFPILIAGITEPWFIPRLGQGTRQNALLLVGLYKRQISRRRSQ